MTEERRTIISYYGALLVALVALSGCDKGRNRAASEAPHADAGAPGPAVDPELAQAVQAAAAPASGAREGVQRPEKDLPETGVFAPGVADRKAAPGSSPEVTLGSTGSAPKVSLVAAQPKPGSRREGHVELQLITGPRSALPTIDFIVALETVKGSGEEGEAPVEVTARVTSAKLSTQQPGRVPDGVSSAISRLESSRVRYEVAPNGAATRFVVEEAKGTEEGLAHTVRGLGDVLATLSLPYPAEPVGKGAFWMVSSRERFHGVDAVVYRMFKVERIDGEAVTLSINTKRYAAGGSVGLPGLEPHTIEQFQGPGKGQLVVRAGDTFSAEGQIVESLAAVLEPRHDAERRINVQLEARARVSFVGRK